MPLNLILILLFGSHSKVCITPGSVLKDHSWKGTIWGLNWIDHMQGQVLYLGKVSSVPEI